MLAKTTYHYIWVKKLQIQLILIKIQWVHHVIFLLRLSRSMFCDRHADHNCHNKHSVTGVAHVEQEVAADGHDLHDGVDDDDDDKSG